MHFQERTTCSESFTSASHPIVSDVLLDVLSLNYFETLMAASGFQAEKSLKDTIANNKGKYIVPVEGAVPTDNNGVYCMIGGKTAQSILQEVSQDAAAVVAWGSCASNGCVQAAKPNPAGATPIHHTDRGSQYCCHEYVNRVQAAGLSVSMTEKDHCAENALAERMNGILKSEYGLGRRFKTKASAQLAVDQAVHLYNHRRPHTALDYRTPHAAHALAA